MFQAFKVDCFVRMKLVASRLRQGSSFEIQTVGGDTQWTVIVGTKLFPEKTNNMQGQPIKVVTFPHIPSTIQNLNVKVEFGDEGEVQYGGLEIEIIKSMGQAMNFQPLLYEASGEEEWGHQQLNGSYTGLLGEVMSGRAQIALGGLQHTLYTLQLVDLSRPYMSQCLTFLTPESHTDNSWKTLILPFLSNVWLAILITLSLGGFIFFTFARVHRHLENVQHRKEQQKNHRKKGWFVKRFGVFSLQKTLQKFKIRPDNEEMISQQLMDTNKSDKKGRGLFLFEELENSILYTYGMLLSVSLPKVPSGWALRIMTGWWWFYCLLIIVSYRASLTAILAKPEPVLTIDTIYELVNSPVRCGGWGEPERLFFTTSFDYDIHQIGLKFETVNDTEAAINRVAKGQFAYYENTYFLLDAITRHEDITNQTKNQKEKKYKLHIMSDCIILMPVSVGLERNSPLKPRIDEFIQRIVEAGLVHKWLSDVMSDARRRHDAYRTVQVEALMDLNKFSGALTALGFGYAICVLALIGENLYWYLIVKRDPLFDKYSMSMFYFDNKCWQK